MKLIKIKGHFYILSDKKNVSHKTGDWVYETNNCIPVYQFSYDMDEYPLFRVLASTIKLGELPLIDLNQLVIYALAFIARQHFPEDSTIQKDMRVTWIERYLNNIKSIEDRYAILNEIEDGVEFDIELEMEEYFLFQDCDDDDAPRHFRPKINNNGFINILKIK